MSTISYLTVYNAHNGVSIKIPKPIRFHSLGNFKEYLIQAFSIDGVENLFLLSSFGIKVNFNHINETSDVLVFDKRLFADKIDQRVLQGYLSDSNYQNKRTKKIDALPLRTEAAATTTFESPSLSVANAVVNEQNLQGILRVYNNWARNLLDECNRIGEECSSLIKQINAIFQSLTSILQFAGKFIDDITQGFYHHYNYVKLLNYKNAHSHLLENFKTLQQFPPVMVNGGHINLVDFVEYKSLKMCADHNLKHLPVVVKQFEDLKRVTKEVDDSRHRVDQAIEELRGESIKKFKSLKSDELLQNVRSTVQSILEKSSELESTAIVQLKQFYTTQKNQTSKALEEMAFQMQSNLNDLLDFRKRLTKEGPTLFKTIANIQLRMVNFRTAYKSLAEEQRSEQIGRQADKQPSSANDSIKNIADIKIHDDRLTLVKDLPLIFGYCLIERRRQYEWNDFFAKGIVDNVSEQLASIVDAENNARKLWNLKYGMEKLSIIKPGHQLRELLLQQQQQQKQEQQLLQYTVLLSRIPFVDISFSGKSNISVPILEGIDVQRDDILKYIQLIEESPYGQTCAEQLRKRYSEMKASTETMKYITRGVSSLRHIKLSSPKTDGSGPGDGSRSDMNVNAVEAEYTVVRELKSRINKLESLLHQYQYRNINSWPVTRNNLDNRMSLIVDSKQIASQTPLTDPTKLLSRNPSTSRNGGSQPSSAHSQAVQGAHGLESSSIDKHLDNIKLRKINSDLKATNETLLKDIAVKDQEIAQLQLQIEDMKVSHNNKVNKLNQVIEDGEEKLRLQKLESKLDKKEVENLESKVTAKNAQIRDLTDEKTAEANLVTDLKHKLEQLTKLVSALRNELNDSSKMKNDLLSNMSSKEAEFALERNKYIEDIARWKAKFEEASDDYENLMELTQTKQLKHESVVDDLYKTSINFMTIIKFLVGKLYDNFRETCVILESMGLLLVKEDKMYKIKRVKGLKSKKLSNGDLDPTSPSVHSTDNIPNSRVVEEIKAKLNWLDDLPLLQTSMPDSFYSSFGIENGNDDKGIGTGDKTVCNTDVGDQHLENAKKLRTAFDENFRLDAPSKLEELLKVISFSENVHLVDQHSTSTQFFVNAILKRFKDVEGFAKKISKDLKAKDQEINKFHSRTRNKIAIKNFEVGDLLLFLPTKLENGSSANEDHNTNQPWAAFNVGSPHYFLKNGDGDGDGNGNNGEVEKNPALNAKEWFIGRAKSIVEYRVTEDNFASFEANPFHLSIGVTWYMVEAEAERKSK